MTEVENQLVLTNLEYATKLKSLRLRPMALFELSNESFESFKNWRVSNGIREAQFKTTPLVSDDSFLDPLTIVSVVTREQAA